MTQKIMSAYKSNRIFTDALVKQYLSLKSEPLDDLESAITDLITDLLHLAHMEGMDAIGICKMAAIHFTAETDCKLGGE